MQDIRGLFRAISLLCIYVALCMGDDEEAGKQFIYYNGTIRGSFEQPRSSCGVDSFDSLADSHMTIGVNPPWDTNPFFFRIVRAGNEHANDPVNDVTFRTAEFICMKGDERCGMLEVFPDYYFLPLQVIDLNEARVSQLTLDDDEGYNVFGDQETFVSNGSVANSAIFKRPLDYDDDDGCPGKLELEWNSTTPFTYSVNFTNTTAEARFSLSAPTGNLTLFFSGPRIDNTDGKPRNRSYNPNNGTYTPISLDTSDPSMPNFTYSDGTGFDWRTNSDGSWGVRSPTPSAAPSASPTPDTSVAHSPLLDFQFFKAWSALLLVMAVAGNFVLF